MKRYDMPILVLMTVNLKQMITNNNYLTLQMEANMSVSGVSSSISSYLADLSGSTESSQTSSTSSTSSSKVYDKKDTNKDGKVSYEEETAYDRKHPTEVKKGEQNTKGSDDLKALIGTIVDTKV
jgi:hypothetical protein